MKLQEYKSKLSELRIKWKSATPSGRKIIETQAKYIKKSIELYQTTSPIYQRALELFG